MDVLAHTLWTNAVFHSKYHKQRKMRYLAAFFGVAPDLVGFTPLIIYLIYSGRIFNPAGFINGKLNNWTVSFAEYAYNYTHSLLIFLVVFLLVLLIGNVYKYRQNPDNSKIWFFWPLLGWALHILIDIPTHPDFYSTPFLFPLSNFRNHHGISWGHPVFMVINYGAIILTYVGLFYYQRRYQQKNNGKKV